MADPWRTPAMKSLPWIVRERKRWSGGRRQSVDTRPFISHARPSGSSASLHSVLSRAPQDPVSSTPCALPCDSAPPQQVRTNSLAAQNNCRPVQSSNLAHAHSSARLHARRKDCL